MVTIIVIELTRKCVASAITSSRGETQVAIAKRAPSTLVSSNAIRPNTVQIKEKMGELSTGLAHN